MAMPAPPQTAGTGTYGPIPHPTDPNFLKKGYGVRSSSRPNSWVAGSSTFNVVDPSPNPHNARFNEEFDPVSQRNSLNLDGSPAAGVRRSVSQASYTSSVGPSRSGTLKKKASLHKSGSLRRSGSRKSMRAGSVRSLNLGDREKYGVDTEDTNSAFFVPIPTSGNPTDSLANRFQGIYACRMSSRTSGLLIFL